MRIKQIYSDKSECFETIKFNDYINVILSCKDEITSHSTGKTKLLELIDFLLLKNKGKELFLRENIQKFLNFTFFLELETNEKKYITISRKIIFNEKNEFKTIDKYKIHDLPYQNYSQEELLALWGWYDLNVKTLYEILNYNVFYNIGFRSPLRYYLRDQDNYKSVFEPYDASQNKTMLPVIFELLGFNSLLIKDKIELDKSLTKTSEYKDKLIKDNDLSIKNKQNINAKIEELKQIILDKRKYYDNFNFLPKDLSLPKDLVENIEKSINQLNIENYRLEKELSYIDDALGLKIKFNIEDTELLFKEINLYFPDNLKKDYETLVKFNKELLGDRQKILLKRKDSNKEKLRENFLKLEELNKKREEALNYLKEKESYEKYRKLQDEIIDLEKELTKEKQRLDKFNQLTKQENKITNLKAKIDDIDSQIQNAIIYRCKTFKEIEEKFANIFSRIFLCDKPSIDIEYTDKKYPKFKEKLVNIDTGEKNARNKGTHYKQVLCASLSIALLEQYHLFNYIRFAFHDGIFDGLDSEQANNFLDLLEEYTHEFDFQYIFTVIKTYLPEKIKNNPEYYNQVVRRELSDTNKLFNFDW